VRSGRFKHLDNDGTGPVSETDTAGTTRDGRLQGVRREAKARQGAFADHRAAQIHEITPQVAFGARRWFAKVSEPDRTGESGGGRIRPQELRAIPGPGPGGRWSTQKRLQSWV
jgi:hypothetical protein